MRFTALFVGVALGLDFDAPIVTGDIVPEVHSLLLTEAPLRAAGGAAVSFALPADISAPVVTQVALPTQALVSTGIMRGVSEQDMVSVCKRTSVALLSEAPDATSTDRILGGPVYRECTAALAPIRGPQSSAVSLLNDCMTLVDNIVAKIGKPSGAGTVDNDALCHDVVTAMEPTPAPKPVAPTEELLVPKTQPQQEQAQVTVTESQDLHAIVAAMPQVCTETVSAVESGIKTEADALKLGNTVAPVCESTARKHLGAAIDIDIAAAALQSWCHQLDMHLTEALQTGFLYALHPVEAQKKFGGPNPYATTTRRQFCTGFNEAIQKAKVSVSVQHTSPVPAVVPASVAPANDALKAPWEVLSNNVAPRVAVKVEGVYTKVASDSVVASSPQPMAAVASQLPASVEPQPTTTIAPQPISTTPAGPLATTPVSVDLAVQGPGVGMLRLMQEISTRGEWNTACEHLTSKLTSHEGSVMEEYAFGTKETPVGTQVLTFNAQDHSEIRNCAANLKVIAIEMGMLKNGAAQIASSKTSLLSVKETITKGAATMLDSSNQVQALIDSPWAEDACGDLAHSYLSAHIAHPEKNAEFCPEYAKDLQSMRSSSDDGSTPTQVVDDVTLLKRRHAQKSKLRAAEALSAHSKAEKALPQVTPRTATALIRGAARTAPAKVVESDRKVVLVAQHVVSTAIPVPAVAKKMLASKSAPVAADDDDDAEGANLWQGMF